MRRSSSSKEDDWETATTHHPTTNLSSTSGILWGWCAKCPDLREKQNTHLGVASGRLQERPPAISTRKCSCQKLATHVQESWSTSSQLDFVLALGRKQHEIARARFCTQSCSKDGQHLVNSSPTSHPMGSCKGLPCNSSGNTRTTCQHKPTAHP